MTKLIASASALVLAVAAVGGPAQAAVSFGSANVHSNARADVTGGTGEGHGTGMDADALSTFGASLDATSAAYAIGAHKKAATGAASASEDASATFASPSSGTIEFSGATAEAVADAMTTAQAQDNGEYYNYSFSVDAPSLFTLTYSLFETYTGAYYNSFVLLGGPQTYQFSGIGNTSGSMSYDLGPGVYTLGLSTEVGDFSFAQGGGIGSGSHDEKYAFDIVTSAAPEPAAWLLMIAGVGLAGGALRGRRRRDGRSALA